MIDLILLIKECFLRALVSFWDEREFSGFNCSGFCDPYDFGGDLDESEEVSIE